MKPLPAAEAFLLDDMTHAESLPALRPAWYKICWSYLLGWKEITISSEYSGTLELWWLNGRLVLNSRNANYSYDTLHKSFRESLASLQSELTPDKNVLLLGMGGGSVINILHREMQCSCIITAIEIDPVVIAVAEKYFGISNNHHLRIIRADAAEYVRSCSTTYDMVIMDIFIDDRIPVAFTQPEFIGHLRRNIAPGGILVANCMNLHDAENICNLLPGSRIRQMRTGNEMVTWKKENRQQ